MPFAKIPPRKNQSAMTDLITGDLHLSENERDAYRFVFLEKTLPALITKHKPKRLLILGDLTEAKDRHSAKLVNRIVDDLAVLSDSVEIIALRGNHDYADVRHPFFRFLENMPNIVWINDVRRIGDDLFYPHVQPSDFKPKAFPKRPGAMFCHQTFEGAVSESGQRLKGISLKGFPEINIISGDVHIPQKISPVTYIGAPYRVRFGDDFDPRVILRDGAKLQSIPVDGPQKLLIEINGVSDLAKDTYHEGIFPNDILKVHVNLKSTQVGYWSVIKKAVRNWGERQGVVIHTIKPIMSEKLKPKTPPKRDQKTDTDLVKEYARNRKLDAALVKTGLAILGGQK